MRLTIAYSKIKKRNLVLINNDTYQRETLSERPIRQPLRRMASAHFTDDYFVKGPYADHILIPQGSTGSSIFFWYQTKAHIFLISNPKFQLQILCSFGDTTKSVKLIGIPENHFLCIFIIASFPGAHTFFCLWRVNKTLPQGETSQNAFRRSRSIN